MNSKFLPTILAVLIAGAIVIAEEQRLAALRQSVEVLNAASAAAQAQMAADGAELKQLRARNETLAAESEELRTRLAGRKSGTAPLEATAGAAGMVGAAGSASPGKPDDKADKPEKSAQGDWMKGVAKMFRDPEMKKVMRAQQSMGMRMIYGDLAKELGLSQTETDAVMELLADRQMDASEKAMKAMDDAQTDPAKVAAAGQEAQAVVTDYEAKLKAALGPEKLAKLNAYERTIGDRMAMQQYSASFSSAGQPLDDAQRAGLLQIMTEERMKSPPGPLDPGNKDVAASMKAMQSGDAMEKAMETQRQLQQRVFDRAHTILTPDQMTAFEAAQKQQIQMQEMGIKMSKSMFGGEKK